MKFGMLYQWRGCPGLLLAWWTVCCAQGSPIFTTLVHFNGTNGANPLSAPVQGADGNLYGTTTFGGTNAPAPGDGTVFQLTTNGAIHSLYSFGGADGLNPQAGLVAGTNQLLYGSTYGSSTGLGTLFSITTNGGFTPLYSFGGSDGANPDAPLLLDADGSFYGTTALGGGKSGRAGTVFQLRVPNTVTSLGDFNTNNGAVPQAAVVRGPDGALYGTTYLGGVSNLGTVFQLTNGGTPVPLVSFAGTNGANPAAPLLLAADGNFYGTTYAGGTHDAGTFFRMTTNGNLTMLASFHGPFGANPQGRLLQAASGYIYGTTVNGGTNGGFGTVFQTTTNGGLTSLHSFGGYLDGAQPEAGLMQAADGSFYGTTYYGGTNGFGTVFRLAFPPPPAFVSAVQTNGTAVLTWSTVTGQWYKLQFRTNLFQTNWFNLGGTNLATNTTLTETDPIGTNHHHFYRAVLLP